MFNNMKNKIREKTGTEIPKFVPNSKLSVTSSRQGSETSLNSLSCPITDVNSNSGAIIKTSDFREIDESSYNEWLKKEEEFQKILTEKENEWRKKEQNYLDQMEVKQKELAETMKQVEDSRNKIIRYQEDKDQLEQYQLQEISKIKHLLLTKEKENCENAAALKESLALVENLKHEVTRLRPLEEQISNYEDDIECLRHSSERERWTLSSKLAQSEESVRHLRDRVEVLMKRTEIKESGGGSVEESIAALREERSLLEQRLEEAHIHLSDIKSSWSGKISSLETQVERLSRQAGEEGAERRKADNLIAQLEKKLRDLEANNESLALQLTRLKTERDALATELKTLTAETSSTESETNTKYAEVVKELEDLKAKLEDSEIQSNFTNEQLKIEVQSLMQSLEHEKLKVRELEESLTEERRQRDEAFLRNAEMSQQMQIAQSDLKTAQQNNDELLVKLNASEQAAQSRTSSPSESEMNAKYAEVVKELEDLKAKLEDSEIQSNFTNEQLKIDVQSLMQSLEHEKLKVRELEQSLTKEKEQRDDVTLRNAEMTRQIAIFAESVKELEDLKAKLEDGEIQSNFTNEQLKIDVQSLMQSLEHEKLKIRELEESLTEERRQRDEAFLRNAEMSQQMQIAQSDLRTAQQDNDELLVKLNASEQAAQSRTSDLDLLKLELNELRSQVGGSKLSDVENELNEKNKTVRMLQQRLSDLKKTLQQELRNNSAESRNHTNLSQNHSNESQNHTSQSRNHSNESKNNTSGEDTPPAQLVGSSTSSSLEDDVNFKYLKHVIIKFLTCRDYEAQHLTRAVAVLLRLSAEEEQSLKDTLDTRGSWWPSRPRILPR